MIFENSKIHPASTVRIEIIPKVGKKEEYYLL